MGPDLVGRVTRAVHKQSAEELAARLRARARRRDGLVAREEFAEVIASVMGEPQLALLSSSVARALMGPADHGGDALLNIEELEARWRQCLKTATITRRAQGVLFPPTAVHFRSLKSYRFRPAELEIREGIVSYHATDKSVESRGSESRPGKREWTVIAARGQKAIVVSVREMTLEATLETESGRFAIRFQSKEALQGFRCAMLMLSSDTTEGLERSRWMGRAIREGWKPVSPQARLRCSDTKVRKPTSSQKMQESMMRRSDNGPARSSPEWDAPIQKMGIEHSSSRLTRLFQRVRHMDVKGRRGPLPNARQRAPVRARDTVSVADTVNAEASDLVEIAMRV